MKRQLFFVLAFLFVSSALFSQTEFLSDSVFIAEHKIRKITGIRLTPMDHYLPGSTRSWVESEYNTNGQLVKKTVFENNALSSVECRYYNLKNRFSFTTDSSANNKIKTVYTYNEKDELISMEYLRQQYGNYKVVFEYKDGRKIKQANYNAGNNCQGTEHYTWKNGRLNTVAYHTGDADTAYLKVLLHYDSKGNETWRQVIKGPGNFYPQKQYKGNQLDQVTYFDYEGKKITGIEYYTWNGKKLLGKKLNMQQEEKQLIHTICSYKGDLLTEHDYKSDLKRSKAHTVYNYRNDSLLSGIDFYFNGSLTQKQEFRYNVKKQLVSLMHLWPVPDFAPGISILTDKRKEKEDRFAGRETGYSYDEKGDTLLRKTWTYGDIPLGNFGTAAYYKTTDTLFYDYPSQKEWYGSYGKCDPQFHFEYGPDNLVRIDEGFIKGRARDLPATPFFEILDTLENTIVNGKGRLILKLKVSSPYAKQQQTAKRVIDYKAADTFLACDYDSLNTLLMKLEVIDSIFAKQLLISHSLRTGDELHTYNYSRSYFPELVETIQFDGLGRPIKKITGPKENGKTTSFIYNPGETIEKTVYTGGLKQTTRHLYDQNKRESKEIVFDQNGQISRETVYAYKNERCSGSSSYMPAARYTERYEYEFYP